MGLIKATGEFCREIFDTHGRISAAGGILVAAGAGTLVAALSHTFLNVHGLYLWAVGLLVFGALVLSGSIYVRKNPRAYQDHSNTTQALTARVNAAQALPAFKFEDYFRLSHASQLTEGTERDFKLLVEQQYPNDKENTLAKFIGIGFWAYVHDMTWSHIYRSQINMLTELNRNAGYLGLPNAKVHYDAAVPIYPDIYPAYSFENWIAYMIREKLLVQHPSNMLEITAQGRDFLKYITHWGRAANDLRG